MTELGLSVQEHGLDKTEVFAEVERMLGAAVRDFASELRLADAADFAAFIRIGHMPNLLSLVQSSAELYFKPGTIELAEPGELELGWSAPPLITLPMKFRHAGVRMYFRLRLAAVSAAVEVESIVAEDGGTGPDLTRRVADALASARIMRLSA
ncbi:MAG: hypothetical protein WCD20_21110 [Rhodomicrobium sp.]